MIELSVKKPTNNGDCLYSKEVLSLSLPPFKNSRVCCFITQYGNSIHEESRGKMCVFGLSERFKTHSPPLSSPFRGLILQVSKKIQKKA